MLITRESGTILGRGVTWDGESALPTQSQGPKATWAIFGSPEFHVTADGRVAAPHLFYGADERDRLGPKVRAPECECSTEGERVRGRWGGGPRRSPEGPELAAPSALIDPFGGVQPSAGAASAGPEPALVIDGVRVVCAIGACSWGDYPGY